MSGSHGIKRTNLWFAQLAKVRTGIGLGKASQKEIVGKSDRRGGHEEAVSQRDAA